MDKKDIKTMGIVVAFLSFMPGCMKGCEGFQEACTDSIEWNFIDKPVEEFVKGSVENTATTTAVAGLFLLGMAGIFGPGVVERRAAKKEEKRKEEARRTHNNKFKNTLN